MTATAAEVTRLRRMVDEDDETTYTDADLTDYIERYPAIDARGQVPLTWDTSTIPPTPVDNPRWIPTYDLHAAAADIWNEKAALLAGDYDFSADGGSYSRSQAFQQAQKAARFHLSRRKMGTVKLVMSPPLDVDEDRGWML